MLKDTLRALRHWASCLPLPASTRGGSASQPSSPLTQTTIETLLGMEALPLELQEQIFSRLFPGHDRKQLVALPVSSASERANVYSIRLTSRRFRIAASRAFGKLVEDVPTSCSEKSMRSLAALVEQPDISRNLECLSLKVSKVLIWNDDIFTRSAVAQRMAWAQRYFKEELLSIVTKAPRLRHMICIVQALTWHIFHGHLREEAQEGPDPMQVSRLLSLLHSAYDEIRGDAIILATK
jgi:hypothetical protein